MAIGVKVLNRPLERVSYVRATLKGMAVTLKHLVDPHKVTMQYPETKWDLSPRWRGTHRMLTTETGKAKCVACGLCPSVCPANCIKLVPGEDEQGNRVPLVFEIDEFRCIFCGYCQEVCPEEAIHLGRHYQNAEFDRAAFVYDLERLTAQTHPVSELWGPVRPEGRMTGFYQFQFYLFSLIAIVSALMFVTRRNPVPAALWLINVMFALSGLYVMLDAPFVGVIQVLVYAGAIMVVFVFVVMLLNLGRAEMTDLRTLGARLGAGLVGLALLANLLVVQRGAIARTELAPSTDNVVTTVAASLFSDYLVAFELTSVVLLVAVVGAVLLAKKRVTP